MEPDPRPRNTGKPHENPRKKATRGNSTFTSSSAYQPRSSISHGNISQIVSQPHSSGSVELSLGHTQEQYSKEKQQKGATSHSFEHPQNISSFQQQPLSPAFMPPRSQDCGLEGKSWQPADSQRPGPSRSFASSGLHAHGQLVPFHSSLGSTEDVPTIPLYYAHHTPQIATKSVEDVHKKEKKPQKPGKYICQYCSRPCAKPSVLQKHIRSHTGERPYPCVPCGFSFKTKSNLYKHRKSHAHRIKAGLSMGSGGEMCSTALEVERIGGEEIEEPTEGESTDSDDEATVIPGVSEDLPTRQKYTPLYSSSVSMESQGSFQSTDSQSFEDSTRFLGSSLDHPSATKSEDTHSIKQKLALQLSKRKKAIDEQAQSFLSPGSKGSTESGYFSRSESAEQPLSSPASNAKSYAEIILGKCGRIGQKTAIVTNVTQGLSEAGTEEKSSALTFPLPKTQVIEHITKLITINEAVVDTSEIDSVKPRRSSLSRRSSIESPKAITLREQFPFDTKPSGCQPTIACDQTKPSPYQGERAHLEKASPAHLVHSITETAPLLRSHSMPSSSSTMSSSSTFRVSHSFDDRFMESEEIFGHGQGFSSHPRMLKRQPAIELPVGMEYSSEAMSSFSTDIAAASSFEQEPSESETTKRSKRGLKVKGLMYECNICSARYKKRDNYEAHKKYYCSELQGPKYLSTSCHSQVDTVQGFPQYDIQPHVMHYKLGPGLEPTSMRKRRKEKSLGDDDEPPSTDLPTADSSTALHIRTVSKCDSTPSFESTVTKPQEILRSPAEKSEPVHFPDTDIGTRIPSIIESSFIQGGVKESTDRRATGKEISVIQHTSSFERSESFEQMSTSDGEEKSPGHQSLQTASQHFHPSHALQPRLVRQHNIQVPEILVTEEPDRPEQDPEPPIKEQEKSEEFQWPQRSQTLSQLPAEKLPPKKKRLKLAEMAQSSGDSSFESASLTRSLSQESSASHISSHSTSFEREEHGKSETAEFLMKSVSSHMLTVPSHPSLKEMRRSASEQAPSAPHTAEMSETRSKSFDYGSLSTSSSSSLGYSAFSTLKERRKCFLVRQASLSKYSEADPDPEPNIRQETEEQRVSSPGKCDSQSKCSSYVSPTSSSHLKQEQQDDIDQISATQMGYKQTVSEALHTFQHQGPRTLMTSEFPLLSVQQCQQRTELAVEVFPTESGSTILSAHLSLPHAAHSLPPSHQLPLASALLHPVQSHIAQEAWHHQTDIAFHQHPSFLHMQFPSCTPFPPAAFLPLQPRLAVQLTSEEGALFKDKMASCSPPSVESYTISTCSDFFTSSRLHSLPLGHTISTSVPLSISPRSTQPLVSFVVPVRIQTHMPSYGSAMYTSLSQILMSQSHVGPSAVVICKVEDSRPKATLVCTAAVRDLDLAQMITQSHRGFFPTPYLTVPSPVQERKGFMSFTSTLEGNMGMVDCPSIVGGSKRMLSPAGSLELTMESQQQKRVKEEDASKPEEDVELQQFASAIPLTSEEKGQAKPHLMKQSTVDLEITSSTTSDEQSSPKEAVCHSQPLLQSVEALQSEVLDEYKLKPGKPFRKKSSVEIKKEDSKEAVEQSVQILSSSFTEPPITWSLQSSKEGMDKKKVLPISSLHTTTNVSWCYLNYIKPNHTQQVDHISSVYAGWCVSLYNPHLPGVSTKVALALLRSKQKLTRETYTMASASRPQAGKLVPSNSRNPKMTEVHLSTLPPGEDRKDGTKGEKEEETPGRQEEDSSTTKKGEPVRIKIFEGGYKSNEEYVYVRGRGRGKYVCEECGIRCKKPSMLKKHIRTHTDVRPYICKYCNFAFKTKGNLTKHMKSKAHSKKCQEMGVSVSALEELEAEEGTSDSRPVGSDDKEDSELVEEHQFSDLEESEEDDDDSDDDEEEEEDESQEEQTLKSTETRHSVQQHYGVSSSHHAESSEHTSPSPEASTFGSHQLTHGYLMTSSSLEVSLSTESNEMAKCSSSLLSHQRPVHSSSEQAASAETEANARQQLLLGLEQPSSRDASPKRRWSPSLEAGSTKAALSRRHFFTKSEMSPKRFASGGDMSPLRCLSPRRGISPKRRLSPGREMSPLRCISPRHDLSTSRHLSPRREFSPRTYLSPERGVSPVRPTSPSTEVSTRYLPLRKMLSSSSSESPPRFHSPIKDGSPCSSLSAGEEKIAAPARDVPFGKQSIVGLPQGAHQKYVDVYEPTQKVSESEHAQEGQSTSTTSVLSVGLQKVLPLPEAHIHVTSRLEDNIFSHLPLHSQQLTRTPCPMIPIGGIQMVQARPSAHPSLIPVDTSLQTGYCMAGSLTEVNLHSQRNKKLQVQLDCLPSFESPAAKVSKYSPLQQTFCQTREGPALEKTRTSTFHHEDVEEKEYRVQTHAELGHSGPESDISRLDSPSTSYDYSSKPSTSREGLLEGMDKKQCGSLSTYFESSGTFISDFPAHTLDRSSSTSCLIEPSLSHSLPQWVDVRRRRNFSGDPSHQMGVQTKGTEDPESADLGQTQRQKGDAGTAYHSFPSSSPKT